MAVMPRRRYFRYRQAYTPRIWPVMVPTLAFITVVILVTDLPTIPQMLGAGLLGAGVTQLRWYVWRRRHPVVSYEEIARRSAEMN